MAILSGLAYGLWVVIVAALCARFFFPSQLFWNTPVRPDASQIVAAFAALAAFYLLPPGSLPPFADTPWGGVLFYGFLMLAAILLRQKNAVIPCLALLVVCAAFSCYAERRVLPGSPFNLGTFAAMPVWETASLPELGAFLLLGVGFILTSSYFIPDPQKPIFAGTILYIMISALWVTLFLPWNTASFVVWPDLIVVGVDFLLFWVKVLVCCFGGSRMPRERFIRTGAALSIAGAVFIAVFSS